MILWKNLKEMPNILLNKFNKYIYKVNIINKEEEDIDKDNYKRKFRDTNKEIMKNKLEKK